MNVPSSEWHFPLFTFFALQDLQSIYYSCFISFFSCHSIYVFLLSLPPCPRCFFWDFFLRVLIKSLLSLPPTLLCNSFLSLPLHPNHLVLKRDFWESRGWKSASESCLLVSCVSWIHEVQSVVPQEANRQINLSPAIALSIPLCSSHFLFTFFSLLLSFDLHSSLLPPCIMDWVQSCCARLEKKTKPICCWQERCREIRERLVDKYTCRW